jgi:hypothetical protein
MAQSRQGQFDAVTHYDEALARLYRAPHDEFVGERKKLAEELARSGDKPGAQLLAKRTRPSVSAWAVNQLYFKARSDFDELFATAARLREGELDATAAHRKVSAALVARASTILNEAGHAASEATLRRVSNTLAALAAAGGFEPDAPGTLASDRDAPGFDAFGLVVPERKTKAVPRPDSAELRSQASEREARAAAAAEKRRVEEEAARARVERRRLEGLLRTAQAEVQKLTRERDERRQALADAEGRLSAALEAVADFERRLAD